MVLRREIQVGEVRLAVTRYASPCRRSERSFKDRDFTRISQKVHPGWSRVYTRVITAGTIRPGDAVRLL